MSRRPLRVLVLAEDPDEVQLLEEAFRELRELQFTRPYLAPAEFGLAESADEALRMLAGGSYEALLADLGTLNGGGSGLLRRVHESHPELPVLFLAADGEEPEGLSLVRQGAQDCLPKSELDCVPLARALRFAVERARIRAALRSARLLDELTGLYTDRAFFDLAAKCLWLAERAGEPAELRLFALQPRDQAEAATVGWTPDADLALIALSEALKARLSSMEVAGRVSHLEIATLCIPSGTRWSADEITREITGGSDGGAGGPDGASAAGGFSVSASAVPARPGGSPAELLSAARSALCENGRARPVTFR